MTIQLSEHFTFSKLLRFTLPSILMMIFTSLYSVVDGIFVSNFVGKTTFAAVNLIMPVLMLIAGFGFMIGTGGSALISFTLGREKKEKANKIFSMLVYFNILLAANICTICFIFMKKIGIILGADGELLGNAVLYGRILVASGIAYCLQNCFQSFLIVAERPKLALSLTIVAGLTNMILDAVFIVVLKWGLEGAAVATVISQCVGGIIPLFYFILPNKTTLRLGKPTIDFRSLVNTCANGSSELVSSIASSVVGITFNFQLLKFAGETGVAAYGALMYVSFIFAAVFLGYGIGRAPIVSFHYGAGNKNEVRNLFQKEILIIVVVNISMFIISKLMAYPFAKLFGSYDKELFKIIYRAFKFYSFAYLLSEANYCASSFFTALNNGFISALISFIRTFIFQIISVLILPIFFGLDGIWLSGISAEFLTFIVVTICVIKEKNIWSK
ncbi:MATE family efflux transporter [Treponema pectinovorum]|uniref:MATE family efflux transporter n=1 Tax=Treponema pectinovorum TaxID=164 RepID=UPI0011C7FC4E|nr:MATE family efflux transporter [Treponema pectinovorum]